MPATIGTRLLIPFIGPFEPEGRRSPPGLMNVMGFGSILPHARDIGIARCNAAEVAAQAASLSSAFKAWLKGSARTGPS